MGSREDIDMDDDDFSEIYKAYSGPQSSKANDLQERTTTNKRSLAGSDEEEEAKDPNAVPTDFTSREAKVWEAKSKATERNWKKRKEEEMICKICGESGHFTQGCPTTLGANRKSQDFFERIPAREPHVKVLFTEKVVNQIEKDIGCKIKIEEKFIIVSGKDRLILKKGVDAVHKIKEDGDNKGCSSSLLSRSRSPERRSPPSSRLGRPDSQRSNPSPHGASQFQNRSPERRSPPSSRLGRPDSQRSNPSPHGFSQFHNRSPERRSPPSSRLGRPDSQRSNPSPHGASQFQNRFGRQEKAVEERVREDMQKISRRSPQAYDNDGARGRSSHSRSPVHPPYTINSYNSYESHSQGRGGYRADGLDVVSRGSDLQPGSKFDCHVFPQTIEDLQFEYKREAMELGKIRDKEEDEENYKHREAVREIRDNYMKKLGILRGAHVKQWEEFLQLDAQKRQHQARQNMSASGFGGYKQSGYPEYERSAGNPHYSGNNLPMDTRSSYPTPMDNYPPSRPHDTYGDLQRQRRNDYEKAYNRY